MPSPPPPSEGYAIGIDLGTTYSCVGVWLDGRVQIVPTSDGDRTFPSYVAFTPTSLLTGHAAKRQAHLNPSNTVFDSKRLIGRRLDDPLTQRDLSLWPFSVVPTPSSPSSPSIMVHHRGSVHSYSPEQISSFLLSALKAQAEQFLHHPVTAAVITVPAYFSDAQRAATRDAGAIAGLNVLRVINEPTAAALAYGLERPAPPTPSTLSSSPSPSSSSSPLPHSPARNVLIFDLGGGTFDVSLLSIEDGVFEVRATAGDTHLGGEDFDAAVMQHVTQAILDERRRRHLPLTDAQDACVVRGDDRLLRRLRTACEQAKRELSTVDATVITLANLFPPGDDGKGDTALHLPFTRDTFHALCGPLFDSTLLPVEQVLRDAKLDKASVHEVVLVGGSTRIPYIQRLLSGFFDGKALACDIDPGRGGGLRGGGAGGAADGPHRPGVARLVHPPHRRRAHVAGPGGGRRPHEHTHPTQHHHPLPARADVHHARGRAGGGGGARVRGRARAHGRQPPPRRVRHRAPAAAAEGAAEGGRDVRRG